jgi:hypothetical protein
MLTAITSAIAALPEAERALGEALLQDATAAGQTDLLAVSNGHVHLVQNASRGARCLKFAWSQSDEEVMISVKVPSGTKAKAVKLDVGTRRLTLAVLGEVIISGDLAHMVLPEGCTFGIEDGIDGGRLVTVTLAKSGKPEWKTVCVGGPELPSITQGTSVEQRSELMRSCGVEFGFNKAS